MTPITPNTTRTIALIEDGALSADMDRNALLYVLSFVRPKYRAAAARQAQRHMFKSGFQAKKATPAG